MPWLKRILAVGKIRKAVLTSHSALEEAGYSIAYAGDAKDAIDLMTSLKFDLVVLSHEQKRAISMMTDIKRHHPTAVLALIHPYPDERSPIVHLAPKSTTFHRDHLLSELRFLFETHSGPTVRKR